MGDTTISYLAGLFDGEGSITYKRYLRKKKGTGKSYYMWAVRMEVSMTDEDVIRYILTILNVGTIHKKPPHITSLGKKMQYRWRCNYRQALKVCKLFLPYARVKRDKIKQIINHYEGGKE
tara:strand:- start:726 stop:1085 length:360 start_codon:yes stop_codon:yes gene_type:complete